MYGYIYKTTNLVTNKIYIGQKKSTKFLAEQYLGSGVRLWSSIKHYGKDAFKVELIDIAESQSSLDEKEIFYIQVFNSRDPEVGYNINEGGSKCTYKGPAWNKGLTKEIDKRLEQSEAQKLKRSLSLKQAYKEGRHQTKLTAEARKKMSDKAKQRPHPPTTLGRKCLTNGVKNVVVDPSKFDYYLSQGYYFGKTCSMSAWNKGLTKETDERVAKYTKSRNKHFENGGSIGCFGVKGNTYAKKKSV